MFINQQLLALAIIAKPWVRVIAVSPESRFFLETGCLPIVDLCNCRVIESDPQRFKVLHSQLLHDKLVTVTNENCMARFR